MPTLKIIQYLLKTHSNKGFMVIKPALGIDKKNTLSAHIWKLKDAGTKFEISWSIVEKAPEFNPTTRRCTLCLKEKYHIICKPDGATLNSRSELFSTCRHRLSKLLVNT